MKISSIDDFRFSSEPEQRHEKPSSIDIDSVPTIKPRNASIKKYAVPQHIQEEFRELIVRAQRNGIDLPRGALEAQQRPGTKSLSALAGFAKSIEKEADKIRNLSALPWPAEAELTALAIHAGIFARSTYM
ncbi:hypothetical protein [Bordetella muralis]|jgi:hypothetical protein|uniref:hypothetical protein n=1 Tax=Bordetella muralis TaxID=1649130 RepID=UPI0039F12D80